MQYCQAGMLNQIVPLNSSFLPFFLSFLLYLDNQDSRSRNFNFQYLRERLD